jgi:hypothetical protein
MCCLCTFLYVVDNCGYHAKTGIRRKCPTGRYGASYGLTSKDCSGFCLEGHYCPEVSTSPTALQCGGPTLFCPAGSAQPQTVQSGYYTIGGNDTNTRVMERLCEPGFWCADGLKYLCLPGYYGDTYGQIHSNCSGPCLPGYLCPEGSTAPNEIMCGDPNKYCPANSHIPVPVVAGFYSVGGDESTRSSQEQAPPGYFAFDGILYKCRAGYYGAVSGLSSSYCSGPCTVPGFYCPCECSCFLILYEDSWASRFLCICPSDDDFVRWHR